MKNQGSYNLEYITIIVCVVLAVVLGLTAFGGSIKNIYSDVGNVLTGERRPADPSTPPGGGSEEGGGNGGTEGDEGTEPDPNPLVCDMDPFGEGKVRMTMLSTGDKDGDGEISVGDTILFIVDGTPMKVSSSNVDMFRIVDITDNKITFMALDNAGSTKWNSADNLVLFNNGQGQQYEDSLVDTLVSTTYYNKLPDTFKDVLVKQNIAQTSWSLGGEDETAELNSWYSSSFSSSTSSGTKYSQKKIGNRNIENRYVTIPDAKDILNWLGEKPATPQNIQKLFFDNNSYQSSSYSVWLRSVSADTSEALYYDVYTGKVGNYAISNTRYVRPVFVINALSLNEWFGD